jgi:perosamine synthetase
MKLVKEIADRIESVLPKRRPIEHHEPFIDRYRALDVIDYCLKSGVGGYEQVEQFEECLQKNTGAEFVLATNSGTAALHLALLTTGVKHSEEVIVPTTTFVATANAVSYVGALPHFVDGSPYLDPVYLRKYLEETTVQTMNGRRHRDGRKITAIIAVHLFGNSVDIEGLVQLAKDMQLILIEDASQAFGTKVNGKHVGTFGWAGILSFNNNKIITTNGGGALLTNSNNIHYEAKKLATTYKKPHKWLMEHDSVAYNYRMGNLNAALGLCQEQRLSFILTKKMELANKYRKSLENMVEFVESPIKCEKNNWLTSILVENRDELLEELHNRGIKARASFSPLHTLPFYQYANINYTYAPNIKGGTMNESMKFFEKCVCLPSGNIL